MKLCFLNANHKASFTHGRMVYQSDATGRQAQAIVSTWLSGQREFATQAESDAANAIEAMFLTGCSVGHLRELESAGDARIMVLNRKPTLNPRIKLNR